jgi:DnaJ-domain-containing protein 1
MPDAARPGLYELLGVSSDASQPDLARAYRRRARELHPDLAATQDAAETFTALTQAYRLLSDPIRRAAYDATLDDPSPPPTPDATAIPVRHVTANTPRPPRPPLTFRNRRRPPIVAGPARVYPNHPETTR